MKTLRKIVSLAMAGVLTLGLSVARLAHSYQNQEKPVAQQVKKEHSGCFYPYYYDTQKKEWTLLSYDNIYEVEIQKDESILTWVQSEEHGPPSSLVYKILEAINKKPFDPKAILHPGDVLNLYDWDGDEKILGRRCRRLTEFEIDEIIKHNHSYKPNIEAKIK